MERKLYRKVSNEMKAFDVWFVLKLIDVGEVVGLLVGSDMI